MSIKLQESELISMLSELRKLPTETEWLELKHNNEDPQEIGEYLSALANGAALNGKVHAYMVWGVDDSSHDIIGTSFNPGIAKIGNEELESWLLRLLSPKINFHFYSFVHDGKPMVLLEIGAAFRHPVQFKNIEYIRIGSYKKKLKDYPEKERELWRVFDRIPFEKEVAAENIATEDVLKLLGYPAYFDLLSLPLPEGRDGILDALTAEEMISKGNGVKWHVTNLGAVLLARRLSDFHTLRRKAVRVILYKGETRVETIREQEGGKGYSVGFEELIEYVKNLLPSNEVIGQALRKEVPMFPELAIREMVANAIIHQDFHITGTAPLVEIFANRMEITNPGLPLVKTDRFLDSPPKSRNEALASFMRRIGVCEERGSGIDKVVFQTELYQLPAPLFEQTEEHTRAVLFAHREFRDMDKQDRIRACYLHACLRYVQRDYMTNSTLRERFGIAEKNSSMASRVIKDALEADSIVPYDSQASRKFMKYLPWWAK
ncbi:ATP-binding protein [Desulfobacter postgatei]|jgi:predicted HTH transcriptional regulator|uniref:ATP-binding protein n=1 Tax=Desulfobacter postgatei TaxID=2293 RepID=UPI002A36FBAD|nr:ATP-binding protein [Desulfobacter postgatei]MDX9964112.1 ATP-binding protein [Desulfobacter postgatei]